MLKVNTKVKDFTLKDDKGEDWTFSDHVGKRMIIYFYPKNETPGCTSQACEFRDSYHRFRSMDVPVIGISADSVESHQSFKENHDLPFTLLSDEDRQVISYFQAYGEKNIFGKIQMGIMRSTFIIDEEGKIEKVYKKASPSKNAGEIIDYLTS